MTEFAGLKLASPILRAVTDEGYTTPTPIQAQSIDAIIDGHDLMGVAQTGTGKTAAFSLPLLHLLSDNEGRKAQPCAPLALILAPTRELAGQIQESIRIYGKHVPLRSAVVFGGTNIRPQIQALKRGVHILVATPGRLIDLMNQGYCRLDKVEVFVLDEADTMLDMGFIPDVRKVNAALPRDHQTIMFSATMPPKVKKLADGLLDDPVHVSVAPAATTAEKIEQWVMFVPKDKKRILLERLMDDEAIKRVLIFTRTKHGANRVAKQLVQKGVNADAIHGNKTQNARQKALKKFKAGEVRVLVATDIASRGIDVDGVTHVINYELPNEPESYVHRIGRTARAGTEGIAISLCEMDERAYLRDIERTIRAKVPVDKEHPWHSEEISNHTGPAPKRGGGGRGHSGNGGGNRRRGQGSNGGQNNGGGNGQRKRRNNAKRSRSRAA
ncbi:MAG: DEAD/DEAH box helicase [bacterium]|nr:DEAD/DEAH box helicase [bacterium]